MYSHLNIISLFGFIHSIRISFVAPTRTTLAVIGGIRINGRFQDIFGS